MTIPNDRRIPHFLNSLVVLVWSALLAGFSQSAQAARILLSWDPPTEGEAAGYKVYGGTNALSFQWWNDAGNTNAFVISNLTSGVTYRFAVSTYDRFGLESDFSETIVYTPAADTNRAPTAIPLNLQLAEDTPGTFQLEGNDPEGDPLAFDIVQGPSHGTLLGSAPLLIYQPAPDFFGTDSLSFRVSDGRLSSSTATVQWTVTPVNDPPLAISTTAYVNQSGVSSIQLQAADADQDPLAYRIVSSPTQGFLTGVPPRMRYQPNANWSGSDSFRFSVRDPSLASTEATIAIQIQPGGISIFEPDSPPKPEPPSAEPSETPPITLIGATPEIRLRLPDGVSATVEATDFATNDELGPWMALETLLGSAEEPEVVVVDPMGDSADRAYRLRLDTIGRPPVVSETWIRRWFSLDGSGPFFPYDALNSPGARTRTASIEPGRIASLYTLPPGTPFASLRTNTSSILPTVDRPIGTAGTVNEWLVVGSIGTELRMNPAHDGVAPPAQSWLMTPAPPFPSVADIFGPSGHPGSILLAGDRVSVEDARDGRCWSLTVESDPSRNPGYYLEQPGLREGPLTGAELLLGPWHRLDLESSSSRAIRFVVTGIRRR